MLTKNIDIVQENIGFKVSTIIGYLDNAQVQNCKFCLEMHSQECYWTLKIWNKARVWIRVIEFPKFLKGDYFNRIVINWLITNTDNLIAKTENL